MKNIDDKKQILIFIGPDSGNKLTIITVTEKIDFNSISKLSDTFENVKNKRTKKRRQR